MHRVTPDVNTLVEGTISGKGPAGELFAAWERGDVALVTCKEIIAEYEDVLRRPRIMGKFSHITNATISASAAALRDHTALVAVTDVPRVVIDDPDDDVVLACALAGAAEYVVSRDHHLLKIGAYQGIPILSPESFARILREQVSEPLVAYAFR